MGVPRRPSGEHRPEGIRRISDLARNAVRFPRASAVAGAIVRDTNEIVALRLDSNASAVKTSAPHRRPEDRRKGDEPISLRWRRPKYQRAGLRQPVDRTGGMP